MNPLEELEQIGDCAFFRLQSQMPASERFQMLLQAVALARARQIPKLLLNLTSIENVAMPNVADRYFIMREIAAVAKSAVKIAFVLPPHLIGDKFGVLVGKNAGLMSEVFTNEPEAVVWLNSDLEK